MGNIEIRFRNNQVYFLKNHGMSSEKFENQIKSFKYSDIYEKYKSIKDEYGVEQTHFPAVNIVFYKSIFDNCAVITPDKFFEEYLKFYKNLFALCDNNMVEYSGKKFDMDALAGRILRTYPSLIRDFDFYLLLFESNKFEQVIYSCEKDIEGKDIIIKNHGNEYTVSLFVDTVRSNSFKKIKNLFRHKDLENEIKLPLNLKQARRCGDFMLYSKKDVEFVAKRIH